MKIFAVVTLSAFLANFAVSACCYKRPFGGVSAVKCNTKMPCPKDWKCVFAIADDSTGVCERVTQGGIDYNRADRAFSSADVDHNGKITFGGAYRAFHSLVPGASEQMLNKLTKNGDKNKDGYMSYSEFVAMYRVLVDKTKHQGDPNDKCHANPCEQNQMCRSCKNTKGYCCETIFTVPIKTPVFGGELTQSERAQANNIFTALNTNKDKGVSRQEFDKLLMAVRQTMGHDTLLYSEVDHYIINHGDTNHDQIVEYSEFLKACQTLKSKDPKSFPVFLNAATKLKPLVLGDPCVSYGAGKKACPAGSSCQRTRVQVQYNNKNNKKNADSPPATYMSYKYFCAAGHATTNCKDCTTAHGKWMANKMANKCSFGSPGVTDSDVAIRRLKNTKPGGVMLTTPKQCDHYAAALKAKCDTYHDCNSCVTKGRHDTLGALCGWTGSWGGGHASCQANSGSTVLSLLVTSTKQCLKPVVVHGRE